MATDVLLVSLGSTHGWRVADALLAGSMRRAGAAVEVVEAKRPREVRTFALTDLTWALAARRAANRGIADHDPRAIVYSTATAALFAPRPGAIRFDALHVSNRPGRHGAWQRGRERSAIAQAPLLVPMSHEASFYDAPYGGPEAVVVPVPVEPSGPPPPVRDIAAITYASDPVKKGLPRVLEAWAQARRGDEELVVVTDKAVPPQEGVRVEDVRGAGFRALVRRSRVYLSAPLREDYGIAQLEALADGCLLVTTEAQGAYVASTISDCLDQRLVGDDLVFAIRCALDDPLPDYAERAAEELREFAPAAVDATVANELLPRLLRR